MKRRVREREREDVKETEGERLCQILWYKPIFPQSWYEVADVGKIFWDIFMLIYNMWTSANFIRNIYNVRFYYRNRALFTILKIYSLLIGIYRLISDAQKLPCVVRNL